MRWVIPTNGQKVVAQGLTYLGDREGPPNRSGDPIVDACQRFYGLEGEPWCAMFAGFVIASSSADSDYKLAAAEVMHPATAIMAERADKRGWHVPGGAWVPPGALFIIPGRHVGFVTQSFRDGSFATLEGNSADAVRTTLRRWDDGWSAIVIPRTGMPADAAVATGYGFDDTRVKLYGGWEKRPIRDGQMRQFALNHPGWWVQPVRVRRHAQFAFRAGPEGTWNQWQYGPWIGKDAKKRRDEVMAHWVDAHEGAVARPWRRDDIPTVKPGKAPAKET